MKKVLEVLICNDESLVGIEENIYDIIDAAGIPTDEYGFHKGTFIVTIEYSDE